MKWYRKAADRISPGSNNLGLCYEHGKEWRNRVEAAKWYRKAAEQNDADAQYNLGMCYERGRPGDGGLGRGLQVAVAGSEARP